MGGATIAITLFMAWSFDGIPEDNPDE